MAISLNESSNYTYSFTKDGTTSSSVVGSASATVNNSNLSLNINFNLGQNYNVNSDVADSVIQKQRDEFLAAVFDKCTAAGLTMFGKTTTGS